MKAAANLVAVLASLCLIFLCAAVEGQNATPMIHSFSDLQSSPELSWTPCYDNFTCALLEVPLDYTDAHVGTTNIAIIKRSSQNASAEDLIVNPGGPGASAVDLVMSKISSDKIIAKVGSQFNLVGLDPRGVKNSGPDIDCFRGYSPIARNTFYAEAFAIPDDSSDYNLARTFQATGAYGDWCTGINSINGTAKYVNTVAVAQDFLRYIELREKSLGRSPEKAKLWYYGSSYGSALGVTFATLFPHRIAGMILDGVMDAQDWFNGGRSSALTDTDEAVRSVFKLCFEVGPEGCGFYQNAKSWNELEKRYGEMVQSLRKSPMGFGDPFSEVTTSLGLIPAVVTWKDLMTAAVSAANLPRRQLEGFASVLMQLQADNVTELAVQSDSANVASPYTNSEYDARALARLVSCLDANGRGNVSTFEQYRDQVHSLAKLSQYGGLTLAPTASGACHRLNIFPPKSQTLEGPPGANKTSAPILWLANVLDPVTPLRSAKKMAGLFPGSQVLTLNETAHTSRNIASKCIERYTRQYMLNATLPPPNTVCQAD